MAVGQVRAVRGNTITVFHEGRTYACRLRGRMRKERWATDTAAAVGDFVTFEALPDGEGAIESVQPRRTTLSRCDAHDPHKQQVIVANADTLVAVHAATQPELNLVNVDRCFVLAEAAELKAALVINKIDLADADVEAYRRLGYDVLPCSATRGDGVEALRTYLKGRTSVFLGPSGVGKSTLLNTLDPTFALKVREVSEATGEGTHTTSAVALLEVGGGLVADTPGIEFFTLWGVTSDNLHEHFPEFDAYHGKCGFSDCRHRAEPRCAVKAAVEQGEILASRYASYVTIGQTL